MSNTIKTLKDGDVLRKALSILHNKLVFTKTINKQYDDRFARSGAKNGGELLIREPNEFTIRSGAIMDTQDVTERTQTLTLATQLGVDVNFSSAELTLSMDDFADRILTPAMTRLAAEVDKTVSYGCYPYVYNFEDTTFGTKPVLADILACRAVLQQGLAPTGDRHALVDALAANAIITDGKSLFHAASEIERQYSQGILGDIAGFKFWESEMTPVHTNGIRSDTTPVTSTAQLTAGTSALTISALASLSGTGTQFKDGDVFTITGVYAVNPETKVRYPHLQQFSVHTWVSASPTGGSVTIHPTAYTSGPFQNIETVTSSTTAVLNNLTADGSGTAETAATNSLLYHRDAFTFVTADLEMPQGVDFAARKVVDGISMRVVRNYDIINDKFPCRFDVLFGYKAIRPQWAVRMCS